MLIICINESPKELQNSKFWCYIHVRWLFSKNKKPPKFTSKQLYSRRKRKYRNLFGIDIWSDEIMQRERRRRRRKVPCALEKWLDIMQTAIFEKEYDDENYDWSSGWVMMSGPTIKKKTKYLIPPRNMALIIGYVLELILIILYTWLFNSCYSLGWSHPWEVVCIRLPRRFFSLFDIYLKNKIY